MTTFLWWAALLACLRLLLYRQVKDPDDTDVFVSHGIRLVATLAAALLLSNSGFGTP